MKSHDQPGGRWSPRLPRRQFVQGAVIAASGATLPTIALADAQSVVHLSQLAQQATPTDPRRYAPVALTQADYDALFALMNRIIPRDDLGPGAGDAGAAIFLDRDLAGYDAALLPLFQAGLASLAEAAGPGGVPSLSEAALDTLLADLASGSVANAPDGFFGLLLAYTRIGMFSDPVHGGNIDFAGWDLLQFAGIKLAWTEAEQAFDAKVTPEHKSVADFGGTATGAANHV
ncbi:MAG: gluconate 2-dehydrogenase subunit 3 family protein [Thermomicrobiales bacterium]